jgi:hypothetical protein
MNIIHNKFVITLAQETKQVFAADLRVGNYLQTKQGFVLVDEVQKTSDKSAVLLNVQLNDGTYGSIILPYFKKGWRFIDVSIIIRYAKDGKISWSRTISTIMSVGQWQSATYLYEVITKELEITEKLTRKQFKLILRQLENNGFLRGNNTRQHSIEYAQYQRIR